MKNRFSLILAVVTGLFLTFTLGFFLGGLGRGGDVHISRLPSVTTAPAAPSQPAAPPETNAAASSAETANAAAQSQGPIPEGTASPVETIFPVDINTAAAEQLQELPGIGPVLAQRIVDYREANGPFAALAELTNVEGIGQKRLSEILDLITLSQED